MLSVLTSGNLQMKKVMEHRFMFVHTLEEAAFNRVVSYTLLAFAERWTS